MALNAVVPFPRYIVVYPDALTISHYERLSVALQHAAEGNGRVYEPLAASAAERVHAEPEKRDPDIHEHSHAPSFTDGPGASFTEVFNNYALRYTALTPDDLLYLMAEMDKRRQARRDSQPRHS